MKRGSQPQGTPVATPQAGGREPATRDNAGVHSKVVAPSRAAPPSRADFVAGTKAAFISNASAYQQRLQSHDAPRKAPKWSPEHITMSDL
jgi:hypothetical protein